MSNGLINIRVDKRNQIHQRLLFHFPNFMSQMFL